MKLNILHKIWSLLSAIIILFKVSSAFTFVNVIPYRIRHHDHIRQATPKIRHHHLYPTDGCKVSLHHSQTHHVTLSMTTSMNNDLDFQQKKNAIPSTDTPNVSKLERDFYDMMREFTSYTSKDIQSIPNPRYRALYEGVIAGSYEIDVIRAFAIVYNDYLPVRIAGRMIYRHLKQYMAKHIEKRDMEEERVQDSTGLSSDVIEDGRKAYMAILNIHEDNGSNSDNKDGPATDEGGQLTMDQLVNSGIIETIVELLDYDSFEDLVLKHMQHDDDGKLSFEKFMIGIQRCSISVNEEVASTAKEKLGDDFCGVGVVCDLSEVFNEIVDRMGPIDEQKQAISVDERKKKFGDRYDSMVATFEKWESTILPSSSSSDDGSGGRIGEVLRGCFTGAKNKEIVSALKIVYMDYSALRVGGDLIFKLMTALVRRREKRRKKVA